MNNTTTDNILKAIVKCLQIASSHTLLTNLKEHKYTKIINTYVISLRFVIIQLKRL